MKARKVAKLDPAGPLDRNAARIIRARLQELCSFAPAALSTDATVAQHDMRIAAKRLRYVIEVTGFCFGKPADAARRRARELQDLLGEIHDCDVMLPRVLDEIERLRADDVRAVLLRSGGADDLEPGLVAEAPNRAAYRGLELLAVHLRARRSLLFERFRDSWQTQGGRAVWAELESAVEAKLPEAERRPKAPSQSLHQPFPTR